MDEIYEKSNFNIKYLDKTYVQNDFSNNPFQINVSPLFSYAGNLGESQSLVVTMKKVVVETKDYFYDLFEIYQ